MTVGKFTYYAYDLMTMTLLAELPFTGDPIFGRILNDSGQFHGELLASDLPVGLGLGAKTATQPARTLLAIDLDGALIWLGLVWQQDPNRKTEVIKVTGKELWSYFEHRIQADYTNPPLTSGVYWSSDPDTAIHIAEQVIQDKYYAAGSGVGGPIMLGANGGFYFAGTHYTSIALHTALTGQNCPVPNFLPSGSLLYLAYNNGQLQELTTTADAHQGDLTISVASFTPLTTIVGSYTWQAFSATTPNCAAYVFPQQGWPPFALIGANVDTSIISQATIQGRFPKQQTQTLEAIVRQLAEAGIGTGFDFSLEYGWRFGPGGPIAISLLFYFPTKGASQFALDIGTGGKTVDLGTAIDFDWSTDGELCANEVIAVGQATAYLQQVQTSSHALAAGYPLLEGLFPYIMADTNDSLLGAAKGELSLVAFPVQAPKVTLPAIAPNEPNLTTIALGDTMRLFLAVTKQPDPLFPNGVDVDMRLVEWEVTAHDDGVSTMDLTFNIPPVIDPPRPASLGL